MYEINKKCIVVTGGNGFLGRHLVRRLRRCGCGQLFTPGRTDYDLTSAGAIRWMLQRFRPDIVIHLAAECGGIGANQQSAGHFFYNNLMMGCQLMECARAFGCEKFLAVGTICSYPDVTPVPFRESELWNGYPARATAPYAWAKKMLIVQAEAYKEQYGFNAVNLLLTNLYGPGDNFHPDTAHVVAAMIHKLDSARAHRMRVVTLWGTGRATREFLYVADAARAIHLAVRGLDTPAPINIGTGRETPIEDLARRIAGKIGYAGEIRFDPGQPQGTLRRCLDVTLARERFGFKATVGLSEGLDRTIRWYRANCQPACAAA